MKNFITVSLLVFGTTFVNDTNMPIYSSDCSEDLFKSPSALKARELAKQRILEKQRKVSNEINSD